MNRESVFGKEIRIFKTGESHEALVMGDRLYDEAREATYKSVSDDTLSRFVKSALSSIDERGFVDLYPNPEEPMPSDVRVALLCQPSYATVAIAIYLKNRLGQEETQWMDSALKPLMDRIFSHGIIGHGFDTGDMIRVTLLILGKAGARTFIEQHPDYSEAFTACVSGLIRQIEYAVRNYDPNYIGGNLSDTPLLAEIPAAWYYEKAYPVFVYGTLLRRGAAASMLKDSFFGGCGLLEGYDMYDLGSFPGIVRRAGGKVAGELFFVDEKTLHSLDRYEGEGSLYRRVKTTVTVQYHDYPCYVYEYMHDTAGCRKVALWRPENEQYVLYAGYGSNLDSKRFRCYIQGGACEANGRQYAGCRDRSLWLGECFERFPGRVYFGNESGSWGGHGVAFYSPDEKGYARMHLYMITWEQLLEVQRQEGNCDAWYGNMVLLGLNSGGMPILTLTSKDPRPKNAPSEAYLELMTNALHEEGRMGKRAAKAYIKECLA